MKKWTAALAVIIFIAGVSFAAAEDKGTAAEAKAMVKKAVSYMKEAGKEKAIAEFNNPKGKFCSQGSLCLGNRDERTGRIFSTRTHPLLLART